MMQILLNSLQLLFSLRKKHYRSKVGKKVYMYLLVMPYVAIGQKAPPFYFWLLLLSHFWINTSVDGTTHIYIHMLVLSCLLVEEERRSSRKLPDFSLPSKGFVRCLVVLKIQKRSPHLWIQSGKKGDLHFKVQLLYCTTYIQAEFICPLTRP